MLFLASRLLLTISTDISKRVRRVEARARGAMNGTSAFSSSAGLCWFKMTVKLWKNFQCLQCRIIMTKEITQSSNLFFLQKIFLSGVIDATVRFKFEGSNGKLFLGCFLEHKLSTR